MTITVVNIRRLNMYDDYYHIGGTTYLHAHGGHHLVYCGRRNYSYQVLESPLANPYQLKREADRAARIDDYQRWFHSKVQDGDMAVADELARLLKLASEGDLELACYCAPKLCHCDVVKIFLDATLST